MEKTVNNRSNGWKITAIIFICLFVAETILFGWSINYALESIKKENKCIAEICFDYDAYNFDETTNVCYCYINHEIKHQEVVE